MKKIKEFFSKLLENNLGESIEIDPQQFRRVSPEEIANENIRRYNKLIEEIDLLRREIKMLVPEFQRAAEEFVMFVSIPKEREEKQSQAELEAKKKNPYLNDFMLRRNEFEDKIRRFEALFTKIADLRKKEISKYFEAKRFINNNSIIIGERNKEIEISDPQENIDEINISNKKTFSSERITKDIVEKNK